MVRSAKAGRDISTQIIERCIETAKRTRMLNYLITETFESALKTTERNAATAADKNRGILWNWPIAVKDCFSTEGVRTTCGSRMLENYVPPFTATAVTRLQDAGAVLLGKTNMDEFCMGSSSTDGFFGPVKNPWSIPTVLRNNAKSHASKPSLAEVSDRLKSDWLIAGGSSGGSAVAVACDVARLALSSDTGGSTRNPAAFCGILGFKPTYGSISRHGLIPLVNSLDVVGLMAKSSDDIATALGVVAGRDVMDSTSVDFSIKSFELNNNFSVKDLRIGLPREYDIRSLSPEVRAAWKDVADMLARAGAEVVDVSLPHTKYSIVCYHVLGECEIASNMARYDGIEYGHRADESGSFDALLAASRQSGLNEVVHRRILAGNYFLLRKNYERFFVKAQKVRRLIAADFVKVLRKDRVDVLLTPATLSDAPLLSAFRADDDGYLRERMDDYFTQPVNMAGIPAIVFPVRLSSRGLPISLQLITDAFEDVKLLNITKWLERRLQFPHLDMEELLSTIITSS